MFTYCLYFSNNLRCLLFYSQFCIDLYGGKNALQMWHMILLAAIEFDVHSVIKLSRCQFYSLFCVRFVYVANDLARLARQEISVYLQLFMHWYDYLTFTLASGLTCLLKACLKGARCCIPRRQFLHINLQATRMKNLVMVPGRGMKFILETQHKFIPLI